MPRDIATLQDQRTWAAARVRRCRARQKAGGGVLPIPVRDLRQVIEVLLARGLITEREARNLRAVGRAVGPAVDDLFVRLAKDDL